MNRIVVLCCCFLWALMGGPAPHAQAAPASQVRSCVLACQPSQRVCSLFENTRIPSGYLRVSRMPYGYKRVKSDSMCENVVCLSRSVVCRPWAAQP